VGKLVRWIDRYFEGGSDFQARVQRVMDYAALFPVEVVYLELHNIRNRDRIKLAY
jgi:hypothetical protein